MAKASYLCLTCEAMSYAFLTLYSHPSTPFFFLPTFSSSISLHAVNPARILPHPAESANIAQFTSTMPYFSSCALCPHTCSLGASLDPTQTF